MILNFQKFNESFSDQIYYKIIHKDDFLRRSKEDKFRVGYCINLNHLDGWLLPNDLFGSLLQALIYFPSRSKSNLYLLRITLPKGDYNIKIRNVDLMLKNLTEYKKSKKDVTNDDQLNDKDYPVIETIIDEFVDWESVKIISPFLANDLFTKSKVNPQDLKMYIFGHKTLSEISIIGSLSTLKLVSNYIFMRIKSLFGYNVLC